MTQAAEQLRISDSVILMELADAVRVLNTRVDSSEYDLVDVTTEMQAVSEYRKLARLTGAAERNEAAFNSALEGDRTPAFESAL